MYGYFIFKLVSCESKLFNKSHNNKRVNRFLEKNTLITET